MTTSGLDASTQRMCWKCGKIYDTGLEECPDDGSRLIDVSQDDRKDPLVGSLFDGRFRIYRKLGEGGMGHVYSARQIDFERDVALKILKLDFIRDENIRKRFMYEARTISNLRHPNAVRLFDFGQAPDGSFYMVMELLEGESLADRLAYRFLTYGEILMIVPPVCGVLGEAHENDVIHRDLKPENIFIVDVGQKEFVKLLDFGIAKHLSDRTMTRSGTLWGTPAYMSPEQAKGERVGAAADIYAIGVMLYELICGNLPFNSSTQMGLALKHISVPARSLLSIPGLASVPKELDDLILSCLSKNVDERPVDMAELAGRLEDIAKNRFSEELMASIPAEEVDAIALQDWLKQEPTVDEEIANAPEHLRSLDANRADFVDDAPIPSPANVSPMSISDESIDVPRKSFGLITGVLAAMVIGAFAVTYFVNSKFFVDEAVTTTSPQPQIQIEPELSAKLPPKITKAEEEAKSEPPKELADAAGLAVSVLLHAQSVAEKHEDVDFMLEEQPEVKPKKRSKKRRVAKKTTKKKKDADTKEVKEIKSELHKTF